MRFYGLISRRSPASPGECGKRRIDDYLLDVPVIVSNRLKQHSLTLALGLAVRHVADSVMPPLNIMLYLAEEEADLQRRFTRARRNDPCPCGSGRKFKYCHGRQVALDRRL